MNHAWAQEAPTKPGPETPVEASPDPDAPGGAPETPAEAEEGAPAEPPDAEEPETPAPEPPPVGDHEPPPPTSPEERARREAIAEARIHYDRGKRLYREGDYDLALIEFQRAYSIAPTYRILFNLGQVNMQLGNYARALKSFQQYLRDGGQSVPEDRRESVDFEVASLRDRTAYLTVHGNTPGAEVRVDGVPMGLLPVENLLVDAGEHTVSVNQEGRSDSEYVVLAGREHASLTIDLPLPQSLAPVVVTKSEGVRPAVLVTWSLTGGFTAAAVGVGVAALYAQQELRNLKKVRTTEGDLAFASKRATALSVTTDVLIGAAVLTGGLSLYLTLTDEGMDGDEGSQPSPEQALSLGPGYLGFVGTF